MSLNTPGEPQTTHTHTNREELKSPASQMFLQRKNNSTHSWDLQSQTVMKIQWWTKTSKQLQIHFFALSFRLWLCISQFWVYITMLNSEGICEIKKKAESSLRQWLIWLYFDFFKESEHWCVYISIHTAAGLRCESAHSHPFWSSVASPAVRRNECKQSKFTDRSLYVWLNTHRRHVTFTTSAVSLSEDLTDC